MKNSFAIIVLIILSMSGVLWAQDPFWEFLLHPEALADTIQAEVEHFSSYDLNGGNDDYARYLTTDPDGYRVMCDLPGPGVITHFWCTHRTPDTVRWKIYVNNMDVPLYDLSIRDLFGLVAPFTPPLADTVHYARYCYVPIPFSARLKITTTYHGGLYYQFEGLRYPAGTVINSLTNPPSPNYTAHLDSLQDRFAHPARPLELGGAVTRGEGTVSLAPGAADTVTEISGNGASRRVLLWLATHERNLHDSLWVHIYGDDYPLPLLSGPVNSLFGAADGWRPFESAISGMSGDTLYLNLPLPFKHSLRVEVENRTAAAQTVGAALEVVARAEADVKPFRLRSVYTHAQPNPAHVLYEILAARGAGNFLGIFWQMKGTNHRTLEGDETIFLNGSVAPQWRGTGTEDYFNGGYFWSDPQGNVDPQPRAAHGPLYLGGGNAAAYRWHCFDPVPFTDGFRMDLECGGYAEVPADYQTAAFYYAPLPRWTVVDLSGDGESYPGEPLRLIGYGLPPQSWLQGARWGETDLVVTGGDTEVRASGVIDFTVRSPVGLDGAALLGVQFADGGETAATAWPVNSTRLFGFVPERRDPDRLVFVSDTLAVSVHGVPAGQPVTIYHETTAFLWVDPTVVADDSARVTGRVVVPAGLPSGELTLQARTNDGNGADATEPLRHYRLIRYEAEDLVVTGASGVTWSDRWAPNWAPSDNHDPWGRNVIRWQRAQGVGDSMNLRFSFPDNGEFRIGYFFGVTTGTTIMQVLLDGMVDVAEFDAYSADNSWRIARSDTVWGTLRVISPGIHTLTVKITGRNGAATAWENWIDQFIIGSEFPYFDAPEPRAELPGRFELAQNFPNPFNPSTQLRFSVPRPSDVRVAVYDLLGREVAVLADQFYGSGDYALTWDASAQASGLYFIRLEAPRTQIVRKAMLIR